MRVVATTRREDPIHQELEPLHPHFIDAEDEAHVRDVELVLRRRLPPLLADDTDPEAATQLLLERSGKRFIYITVELSRLKTVRERVARGGRVS